MFTLLFCAAMTAQPGGHPAPSWHWTKKLDGSIGYVWGYKDGLGRVHSLMAKPIDPTEPPISYGVDRTKFGAMADREWFGGNAPAPRHVGATGQPQRRVHVTIIGPEAARKSARADLAGNPAFTALAAELGDSLAVQDYDPTDPMISGLKLADGGSPDVVVQSENGRVRFRAHDYPGANRIAEEVRRADPKYDPKKDPDGKTWKLDLEDYLRDMPDLDDRAAIIIVLGCVLVAVLLKK